MGNESIICGSVMDDGRTPREDLGTCVFPGEYSLLRSGLCGTPDERQVNVVYTRVGSNDPGASLTSAGLIFSRVYSTSYVPYFNGANTAEESMTVIPSACPI